MKFPRLLGPAALTLRKQVHDESGDPAPPSRQEGDARGAWGPCRDAGGGPRSRPGSTAKTFTVHWLVGHQQPPSTSLIVKLHGTEPPHGSYWTWGQFAGGVRRARTTSVSRRGWKAYKETTRRRCVSARPRSSSRCGRRVVDRSAGRQDPRRVPVESAARRSARSGTPPAAGWKRSGRPGAGRGGVAGASGVDSRPSS